MKEFFTEMFSAEAKVSSMRWVFVWTYGFSIVVPISSWSYAFYWDHTADLPSGIVTLVTLIIGTVTAGKAFQSKVEGKDVPKP